MKIAIVSDAIYPYNKGGKEKRIYEVSTRLSKLGHEVHIYTMHWWGNQARPGLPGGDRDGLPRGVGIANKPIESDNRRVENGVHLHAISPYYPLYSRDKRSIKQAILFGLSCFKLLFEDFDIVDVDHMPFFPLFTTKLVCLLKGKKMIATWHEVWGRKYWKQYLGILGNIAYLIERVSLYLPDKIIAVSTLTATRLKNEFHYKGRVEVVQNGIDYQLIQKIKSAVDKSDVIFVGRLLSHKNVDVLIKAVKLLITDYRLPITCFIVGEGPEKNNLQDLTKKLNLDKNIFFFNSGISQEKVYSLMKSSKVFVLPSAREGFGIVVLEANACGLPVITINHKDNAAKELIENNINGIITDLNSNHIVQVIRDILQNGERFILKHDLKNSWDKIIQNLLKTYML